MPSELGSRLRALGLALLNATLMLAALVLLLAVLLVWQLRGFASDMQTSLAGARMQLTEARLNARSALEALGDPAREAAARQDLAGLVERLDALDPPALPEGDSESLLRRLVLAIIATAAQGLMGEAPGQ